MMTGGTLSAGMCSGHSPSFRAPCEEAAKTRGSGAASDTISGQEAREGSVRWSAGNDEASLFLRYPLLLMFACPVLLHGACAALFSGGAWPSLRAAFGLATFAALQWAMLRFLPGSVAHGPVAPCGSRPHYQLNGALAYALTVAVFVTADGRWGGFRLARLHDCLGELLATASVAAFVVCALLLAKARWAPTPAELGNDCCWRGSLLADLFWGVELHPRLGGVALKQLVNARLGMMAWQVVVLASFAKHVEMTHAGDVLPSPALSAVCILQTAYIAKFFVWEEGYLHTLDIAHDRCGFYLCWGCLCWVPGFYACAASLGCCKTLPFSAFPVFPVFGTGARFGNETATTALALCGAFQFQNATALLNGLTAGQCTREFGASFVGAPLSQHGVGDAVFAAACVLVGLVCVYVNYEADVQKQVVRRSGGACCVWGHPAEVLEARYRAQDGSERKSLLLCCGWWAVARHFHYAPELLCALCWTAPVALKCPVVWAYPGYLLVLLVDRCFRDEKRCAAKYGRDWGVYCRLVRWRILPGVF